MKPNKTIAACPDNPEEFTRAIRDTIDFFNGKWKLPILGALMHGSRRFNELERMIPKITPRMLSKELRDLEMNKVVVRAVYDTVPPTVEYTITPYGKSANTVLEAMHKWGVDHRKKILEKV
jgi:DNA-binding HxlR family transcriptional regulator